jgi:hypothetical protein
VLKLLPRVLKESDEVQDAGDLLDELLAVAETGLDLLTAGQLLDLKESLQKMGHIPDASWIVKYRAELSRRATSISGDVDHVSLVSLIGALAAPFPGAWELTAENKDTSILSTVSGLVERGKELGGFSEEHVLKINQLLEKFPGGKEISKRVPKSSISVGNGTEMSQTSSHASMTLRANPVGGSEVALPIYEVSNYQRQNLKLFKCI